MNIFVPLVVDSRRKHQIREGSRFTTGGPNTSPKPPVVLTLTKQTEGILLRSAYPKRPPLLTHVRILQTVKIQKEPNRSVRSGIEDMVLVKRVTHLRKRVN
jgi:hypothetical protein